MSPADDAGAAVQALPPFKPLPQKAPDISVERRDDGSYIIRSNHQPGDGPRLREVAGEADVAGF